MGIHIIELHQLYGGETRIVAEPIPGSPKIELWTHAATRNSFGSRWFGVPQPTLPGMGERSWLSEPRSGRVHLLRN